MPRTDLYFKVTVDHEPDESLERIGNEIVRQIERIYVVRCAELSNFVTQSGAVKTED